VVKAIKGMRNKDTEDDDVPGHVLKLLGEGRRIMTQLINNVHETGRLPKDFTEVKMTALKKKPEATKCINHHTINLITHAARIVVRLLRRLRMYLEKINLDLEDKRN
jgi:hypothetical protein